MKNLTLLSLVAAALLFTACGEKTKKAASEATDKVTEAVKADTTSVVESAKKVAADAAAATKAKAAEVAEKASQKAAEVKAAAEAKATEAADALKERATATTAAVTEALTEPTAYAKCKGCHGADGKTKALDKSAVLAGQDKAALVEAIKGYQAGTRNVAGMGMLMKGQVAGLSDADVEAIAEYLSKK